MQIERCAIPNMATLLVRGGEGVHSKSGGHKTEHLRIVDWEHPSNNNFVLVSQFSITGALYTCRPDLVGFVHGLPLVVIELKKPGARARRSTRT
jgi:type I site-specific restriction-modification system R (restriction) subunit